MNILFDHCVPKRLRRSLSHPVKTTREMGWERLRNGILLAEAAKQFDLLLTVDQNIKHQQNMATLPISCRSCRLLKLPSKVLCLARWWKSRSDSALTRYQDLVSKDRHQSLRGSIESSPAGRCDGQEINRLLDPVAILICNSNPLRRDG